MEGTAGGLLWSDDPEFRDNITNMLASTLRGSLEHHTHS